METNALFDAVRETLEELSLRFEARPDEGRFRLLVEGKAGFWDTHIHYEPDPAFVHVVCVSPVKSAPSTAATIGPILSILNSRLRLRAFYQQKDGYLAYRLAMPLLDGAEVKPLAHRTVVTALSTVDDQFQLLALSSSNTPECQEVLADLTPESEARPDKPSSKPPRFQLN